MFLNAQTEGDGISLALYSQTGSDSDDTITVDARGRVLIVSPKDSNGLLSLANKTLSLPKTNTFWNSWRIQHNVTCLPNHRIFVRVRSPNEQGTPDLHQITVYGFSKERKGLSEPVEGISELPDALWELFGLVLEARNDSGNTWDNVRDETILGKVREALKGVSDATE